MRYFRICLKASILILPLMFTLQADVVTLKDGGIVRGIIQKTAASATAVTIATEKGQISIPRTRIANVQEESPAQGRVQLGDAYRAARKYSEAMREYQAALNLDPANTAARQG